MSRPPVDPKRTGVKARLVPTADQGERTDDGFLCGLPGDMVRTTNQDGSLYGFLIACPGCGQYGGIALGDKDNPARNWRVTAGGPEDVTTLSVEPSILIHCCGWHGYLRNGVFESC